MGLFVITSGSEAWQFKVAKKYARQKGANLLILKSIMTTIYTTHHGHGGISTSVWSSRTFIFGRVIK